jgi:uncharacterized delta-60 repeat protein
LKIRLEPLILLFLLALAPALAFGSTWTTSYGGSANDYAYSIQETSDNGFIVAGRTTSYGAGFFDYWVLRLDANGNVVWQKTYGGSSYDYAYSIQETSDGGFIVAGYIDPYSLLIYDFWVLKLGANGNVVWQKTYGGSRDEIAYSIQETSDSGFIVGGITSSYGAGEWDYWILKLDANGNVVWQKTYGGASSEQARSIQETSDNGFIVAGFTNSYGAGNVDCWVLKLDANGIVVWQKTYGGAGWDSAESIQETSDGGFIMAGWTDFFGSGKNDYWVLKLDANGTVVWQKTYGGPLSDYAYSIQETSDNGFVVAGYTWSYGAGFWDSWVLKLDTNGNVVWQKTYGSSSGDEFAYSIQETSDSGFIVAGRIDSDRAGNNDYWVLKLDSNGSISNCNLIQDTSVVTTNSDATIVNTNASPQASIATVTNTSVEPTITDAAIEQQCFYNQPPLTEEEFPWIIFYPAFTVRKDKQ